MSQIELEIAQLSEQLQTLRLPHKLNQYRDYQRRLLSLRKLTDSIATDVAQPYQAQLDKLQSQLDGAVLCGVSECFLCGPQASKQSNVPFKSPVYNRSVSASFASRPRPNQKPLAAQQPLYSKQISYNEHLSRTESSLIKLPASVLPTPPESPAAASVTSEDGLSETDITAEEAKEVHSPDFQALSESNTAGLEQKRVPSPKPTQPDDIQQSHSDESPPAPIQLSSGAQHIEKASKPQMEQKNDLPKPKVFSALPYRTSSYRAYKDFVNTYSLADRNKAGQTTKPDKKVA